MPPKDTTDGYVKISTVDDLLLTIQRQTQITSVCYQLLKTEDKELYYVALWALEEKRGYGGCVLSLEGLAELKRGLPAGVVFKNLDLESEDERLASFRPFPRKV